MTKKLGLIGKERLRDAKTEIYPKPHGMNLAMDYVEKRVLCGHAFIEIGTLVCSGKGTFCAVKGREHI